jgi:hypothetical protein
MLSARRVAGILLGVIFLNACGTTPLHQPLMASGLVTPEARDLRWHTACFRLPFNAQGQPVWATDLVLADRVAAPVLRANAREIPLWRFHRRAVPDAAGHQFSMLVYTTDEVYAAIRREIASAPTVQTLRTSGYLQDLVFDCRPEQRLSDIGATSDPRWDPALQRAWPYFIMGVSASWLALIQTFAVPINPEAADLPTAYAAVEARITELWGIQGQHAYLHHLGAIYGYQPVQVQSWMNF